MQSLALLLFHRAYLNQSFLWLFSLSLTLVDTLLSLCLSVLHLQGDTSLLGLNLTRHHVCLQVQLARWSYDHLLWPVVVLTVQDHQHSRSCSLSDSETTSLWGEVSPS